MPITIQEIIASDTISQMVDKTNFNFDQLLLNGGGPAGPIGPAGPTGPAGGRGPKGTTWYEDTSVSAPGASPNVVPPTSTPLEGDYYLQFNGQVWEYNGNTWVVTTVDLQGPTGPAGQDGGFGSFFGQGNINNKNTVLPTPTGAGAGANAGNEGIPTVLIGGAASNTSTVGSGIPLTGAYQITDTLATSISSEEVSLLIHQKNSSATAIKFMGGAASLAENYSQNALGDLVTMQVAVDDGFIIDIPKPATNPTNNANVNGFSLVAPSRGQTFRAGGQINLSSGENSAAYGFAGENGNFAITVGSQGGGGGAGNQFQLVTQGTQGATNLFAGANITVPASTTNSGTMLLEARDLTLLTASDTNIRSGGATKINANGIIDIFSQSNLTLNGTLIQMGYDLGGAGTTGILAATTNVNNVDGIKLLSGIPGGGSASGTGIVLKTFQAGQDIKIIAENPGVTGGIQISAGPGAGNLGYVDIDSHGANISTNSDGGDTIMQTDSKELLKLKGSTGEVIIGGVSQVDIAAAAYYKPTAIIAPSGSNTWLPGSTVQLPRVHIGIDPTFPANQTGIAKFNGGAELIGPYGATIGSMGNNVTINEPNGALHIKGGLRDDGRNPGAVYIYTEEGAGGGGGGDFRRNSVRAWATGRDMPRFQGATSGGSSNGTGLVLGQNINAQGSTTTALTNPLTEGRIYMYGQRNSTEGGTFTNVPSQVTNAAGQNLDQAVAYPHANVWNYAGVNVGDAYRGRQEFKVWGDYTGDHYISVFDGAYSGPSIEQQCFMSGAQTWSSFRTNEGTNNSDEDLAFRFKYQWQRVGRVVTGSGHIELRYNWDGGNNSPVAVPNGGMLLANVAAANAQLLVGPIPLPMQLNLDGGNRQDNAPITASSLKGAQAVNISGTVQSKFDWQNSQNNSVSTYRTLNGGNITGGINYNGPLPSGDVRGGTLTGPSGTNPSTATLATHMYVNLLSNFSNSQVFSGVTYHGIYAPFLAFTFTYEMNTQ